VLEQVLFNLLDNAYKYGGDTGASIHARGEGSEVVISVTDDLHIWTIVGEYVII
jgi:two-component system sensor histidine kinase KdpD